MTLSTIHRTAIQRLSPKSSPKYSPGRACADPSLELRPDLGAGLRHFLLVGAAAAILAMAPAPAFAQHAGGHAGGGGGGHSSGGFGGGHSSGGGFGGGHASGGTGGGHASGGSHGSGGATNAGGRGAAEGGSAGGSGANSPHSGESGRSAANPNGGGHWWSGVFGGGHSNSSSGRGAANANAANANAEPNALFPPRPNGWTSSNVSVAQAARENTARQNALHANTAPPSTFFQNGVRLTTPANVNSLRARQGVFASPLRPGTGTAMAPAQNNSQRVHGLLTRPGGLNGAGGLALRPGINMAAAPRGRLHPPGYFYNPYYYNPFFYSGFGNCYYGYCGAGFGPGWGWGFGFGAGYYGFGGSYWNAACDPVWGCQGFGYNGWGYNNSGNYNNTSNGSGDYTIDAGGQSQESNPGPYVNPPADMNGDAQAGVDSTGADATASVAASGDSSANSAATSAATAANAATPAANEAAPIPASQLFVLYMKDGSSYAVSDYWLGGGKLHYVTSYGGENTVDLAQLDVQKTVDVNSAAGRKFSLRAGPAK